MQEDIERIVADAEQFKAKNGVNKNRMEGKNTLENYCYSIKSSISSDDVKYKVPVVDTYIEESIEESIK